MRMSIMLVAVMLLVVTASALALERGAYQMREDYDAEPLYDCAIQYYYYIPCPTYSWFWVYTGWDPGDVVGAWFEIGEQGTGGWPTCSALNCHVVEEIRVLDFAGYGQVHPGLFTVEFDIYCADETGCPVGPSLWNSGRLETGFAWNYIPVDPPVSVCGCVDPPLGPRIVVTANHVGMQGVYPAWGMDNISTPLEQACALHDLGCLPVLYPRPYTGHYPVMHSGFYGQGFEYCPPQAFLDGRDTTSDGTQFGFIELAWRVYVQCTGPTSTEPATWGDIKSMYR